MTESELHPFVESIAREARRPVVTDPAARERIMAAVRAEPVPVRVSGIWSRLVAPQAFRLSPASVGLLAAGLVGIGVLVGDFNGWDTTKTPLSRTSKDGVWSVTLPLSAGRHIYAYVVDGSWSADPHAPLAPDDGFGHANSVKLVRGGSSL